MRRFDMRLPASVRVAGKGLRDLLTETQNVSARGVFFYLDRPLAEGTRIRSDHDVSAHVTLTEPVRVRFTARVVRVENSPDYSGIGVAAMIEEYEFLRSNPNQSSLRRGRIRHSITCDQVAIRELLGLVLAELQLPSAQLLFCLS